MNCQNQQDSKLAQDVKGYYFYCAVQNAMTDHEDCRKCKYNNYRKG